MRRLIQLCVHFLLIATILALLAFCILLVAMQTQWAKRYISEQIVTALKVHGIDATIDGVGGQLPFSWKVDHMTLHFDSGATLDLDHTVIRSSLFPFLSQHLISFYCHVEKAHLSSIEGLEETEVEIRLSAPWSAWKTLVWNIPSLKRSENFHAQLQLSSPSLMALQAKGKFSSDLKQCTAIATYTIHDLSLISSSLTGNLTGKGYYENGKVKMAASGDNLFIDRYPLETAQVLFEGALSNSALTGCFQLNTEGKSIVDAHTQFRWDLKNILELSEIAVTAEETSMTGDLEISLGEGLVEGSLYGNVGHLSQFSSLFPNRRIEGKLGLKAAFSIENSTSQTLRFYCLSKNLRYSEYLIDDLSFAAEIIDLYNHPEGHLEILAENVLTPQVYFNQISLTTESEEENWPFSFHMTGSSQEPCYFNGSGSWQKEDDSIHFHIQHAKGEWLSQEIVLESPFDIEWDPSHFILNPSEWHIGSGSLSASLSLSPLTSVADLKMEHFPLQILSIFKPKFSIEGSVTGHGLIEADEDNIQGFLNLVLEQGNVLHYGKKQPWRTKGSLQAHVDHGMLQLHTDLHASGDQFLDFSASFPLVYTVYPFQIEIDSQSPFSGELVAEGKIQDIFDFINIGTHHITGLLSCRLLLSQTYADPFLQGKIELQNGTYENYYTGMVLKQIQAEAEALKNEFHLISLKALDEEKGKLRGKGVLELKPEEAYPYRVTSELDDLHLLRFDMIDCYLTGPLYITGTTQSALAEGNLTVSYATIHIPDKPLYNLPQFPTTFINRPSFFDPEVFSPPIFPFHINLELTADSQVHVEGKGLSSEWKGSVHLTGTNTAVAASGSLSPLSGEYLFSGRMFKLTEGEIIFNDKPTPSAYLNLSGNLDLLGVEIRAQLRGPLTAPKLTFQSNPHLPTSSILSLILFNKEITDISHPKATQLASILMSLSGGDDPDVLETIRKSIGVDQLTIVSSGAKSNQIAVQIGKYLTKGVLITLSQSATSSQVIVEVELGKNFVFQAETQEKEEGKFSLKWRKNY